MEFSGDEIVIWKDMFIIEGYQCKRQKQNSYMAALKASFVKLDYTAVSTHFNSGNVIFSSDTDDMALLANTINAMIKNKFVVKLISRIKLFRRI